MSGDFTVEMVYRKQQLDQRGLNQLDGSRADESTPSIVQEADGSHEVDASARHAFCPTDMNRRTIAWMVWPAEQLARYF
jgi:hypothetical protein